MGLRFLFVGLVLLLVLATGFAKDGATAAPAGLHTKPMSLERQVSEEERNARIQLMKALDAELQARAAERNAPPAEPLFTAAIAVPPDSMQ